MRCPACRHPALEHDLACAQCGFSLEALAPAMGIPPVLQTPLSDVERVLSSGERRNVLQVLHHLQQRFPQVSFAAVLTRVSAGIPLGLHAFWLFNKGGLFSAVERGGDNHGVLLMMDLESRQAVAMVGYGLEPFVSALVLEVCLTAASGSLVKAQFGAAIGAFARELERQLTLIANQLPQTFGYGDDVLWTASGHLAASLATDGDQGTFDDLY